MRMEKLWGVYMNDEIIKKINKEIMDTKVNNIIIKEFESIVRDLQDKDKEIRELKNFKNIPRVENLN